MARLIESVNVCKNLRVRETCKILRALRCHTSRYGFGGEVWQFAVRFSLASALPAIPAIPFLYKGVRDKKEECNVRKYQIVTNVTSMAGELGKKRLRYGSGATLQLFAGSRPPGFVG